MKQTIVALKQIRKYCKLFNGLGDNMQDGSISKKVLSEEVKDLLKSNPPPLPFLGVGFSRIVFRLTEDLAVKIALNKSGRRGNMAEIVHYEELNSEDKASYAKPVFKSSDSLILVMEYCKPLENEGDIPERVIMDNQLENFGITKDGRIVAVDFTC